jgi:hypothetical protein
VRPQVHSKAVTGRREWQTSLSGSGKSQSERRNAFHIDWGSSNSQGTA